MLISIYGLIDPRDGSIHYIGKAAHAERRLLAHMRGDKNAAKTAWIKELKLIGLTPELVILETSEDDQWQLTEKYWINYGREEGWPLTNISSGGKGGCSQDEYMDGLIRKIAAMYGTSENATNALLSLEKGDKLNAITEIARTGLEYLRQALQYMAGDAKTPGDKKAHMQDITQTIFRLTGTE